MNPERYKKVNGYLVEEFYWAGNFITYIDHRKTDMNYEDAIEYTKVKQEMKERQGEK